MIPVDPIALRVARRHEAAVVLRDVPAPETRIEYSNDGRISALELMRWLRPKTGPLLTLRFRRSLAVDPNGVEWEALDENANVVTGQLILHAAVANDEVVSWAEVVIDPRLEAAAERVAREYQRRGDGLVPVDEDDGQGEDREDDDDAQAQ
jgi:hypothetical protein